MPQIYKPTSEKMTPGKFVYYAQLHWSFFSSLIVYYAKKFFNYNYNLVYTLQ